MDGATVIPFPNAKAPPVPQEPDPPGDPSQVAIEQCAALLERLKAGELQAFVYAAVDTKGRPVCGNSAYDAKYDAALFIAASMVTKGLLEAIGADYEETSEEDGDPDANA